MMKFKTIAMGAVTAAFLAVPAVAYAAWGQATGDVNMRTGPDTSYPRITVIPAGASVWIEGSANGWYRLRYGSVDGYVSSSYIAPTMAGGGPPAFVPAPVYAPPPPMYVQGPPPTWGYYRKPWWDDRYHAWYDGRRWYRDGNWYNEPSGITFGFSFGR